MLLATKKSYRVFAFAVLWVSVIAAGVVSRSLLGVAPNGIDDAQIFFVYANHFADGAGFVYNIGSERVEGFSSLLWVLLIAPFFWLGIGSYLPLFLLTSFLSAVSIWSVIDVVGRRIARGASVAEKQRVSTVATIPMVVVLALGWLFASPGWFLWNTVALMDVSLWTCLLCLMVREYTKLVYAPEISIKGLVPSTVLLALMVFTRPEAMGWGLFFIAALLVLLVWRSTPLWRRVFMYVGAYAAALLILLTFRLTYFGYPLPNTYYAKISQDFSYNAPEGLAYVGDYLASAGLGSAAVVGAIILVLLSAFRAVPLLSGQLKQLSADTFATGFLSFCIVVALVFIIYVGGDNFAGFRFLQPVYPLLFLWVFFCWCAGSVRKKPWHMPNWPVWSVPVGALALAVIISTPMRASWRSVDRSDMQIEFDVAARGLVAGKTLGSALQGAGVKELPSVGVTAAGGFKYAWDGDVLDLMGLNSTKMAHAPGGRKGIKGHAGFNAGVLRESWPVFMLPNMLGWPMLTQSCDELADENSFQWNVLDGFLGSDDFQSRYSLVQIIGEHPGLCVYVDKVYLQGLAASGRFDFLYVGQSAGSKVTQANQPL